MPLSDVINITLSNDTPRIASVGFGVINICGTNLNSSNRIEYFSTDDLSTVAASLASGINSPEYKAAQLIAMQNPKPAQFAISQIIAPKILTDNAGTFTAGTIKVTVNDEEVSQAFATSKDATLTDLASAIQDLDTVQSAVYDNTEHTITITPVAGTVLKITTNLTSVTGTITMALSSDTASETYVDGLNNIVLESNDWYGLMIISRTSATVLEVMAWTETAEKLFMTSSSDTVIIDSSLATDSTSIIAIAKSLSYARSVVLFHANATTEFPEAGFLSYCLARTPGSYTAKFKKIIGVTPSRLTPTQIKNARDKKANVFEYISGLDISFVGNGTVASGERVDIIHFTDWFKAKMMEAIVSLFIRTEKVPYTPEGLVAIKGEMDKVGSLGIASGGFSNTRYNSDKVQVGGFYSIMPDFDLIPVADRANRVLKNVKCKGFYAGAVEAIEMNMSLSVSI